MKKALPTESDIIDFHKSLAPSEELFDIVHAHSVIVWRIAELCMSAVEHNLDKELVKASCLLHDVGIYKLIKPGDLKSVQYVKRGIVGEKILREQGYPDALCLAVARHVGLGLTRARIEKTFLPLPPRDLAPCTHEERLINYVSKLHVRSDEPQFNSVESYRLFIRNLEDEYNIDIFESLVDEFGEPNLGILAEEFNQKLA